MKKRWYVLLAAALLIACFAYIAVRGDVYVLRFNTSQMADPHAVLEQKEEILRIAEEHTEGGELVVTVRSVSRGHAYVDILDGDEIHIGSSLFVHPFGIITDENYFGDCTGGICLPIAVSLFLLVLLIDLARQYRTGMKRSLYQYRNVRTLALIIYLAPLLLTQVIGIFRYHGLEGAMRSLLRNGSVFANFAFPAAFVLSILVTLSNLRLMRREGRTWRNMLGCILGLLLLLSTIFPAALGEYLQRSTLVDVHNERGRALYVELAVEDGVLVLVSYLECVLIATIALTVKAARRVPAFDKDCMLILGCQIKKDGTLTNLLRGRADRALDFARIQAEATGKALTFVPSGGQGADEVCSEGEAIRAICSSRAWRMRGFWPRPSRQAPSKTSATPPRSFVRDLETTQGSPFPRRITTSSARAFSPWSRASTPRASAARQKAISGSTRSSASLSPRWSPSGGRTSPPSRRCSWP